MTLLVSAPVLAQRAAPAVETARGYVLRWNEQAGLFERVYR
jgi:hypothetical protein